MPMRMMAYVAGFGGGKELGVKLVQQAAAGSGEARIDALFALVLIYNREGQFAEALGVLRQLRTLYPRNRLVLLEAGATALRGGRAAEAEARHRGLGIVSRETRPRFTAGTLWRKRCWHDGADATMRSRSPVRRRVGGLTLVAGRARVELSKLRSSAVTVRAAGRRPIRDICVNENVRSASNRQALQGRSRAVSSKPGLGSTRMTRLHLRHREAGPGATTSRSTRHIDTVEAAQQEFDAVRGRFRDKALSNSTRKVISLLSNTDREAPSGPPPRNRSLYGVRS